MHGRRPRPTVYESTMSWRLGGRGLASFDARQVGRSQRLRYRPGLTVPNRPRRARLPAKPVYPFSLWLELTAHCNLSCSFCYNAWRPDSVATFPVAADFDDLTHAVDSVVRIAQPEYVALSGGEPLLYRELDKLVVWLASRGLYTILTSNGKALSSARVDALRRAGLSAVQIPLHSTDWMVHDALSGGASWDAAVLAVRRSVKAKLHTSITVVVTERNDGDVRNVMRLAAEMGVDRVVVNHLQIAGSARRNHATSMQLSHESEWQLRDQLASLGDALGVDVVNVPSWRTPADAGGGWHRLAIGPELDLKLCNLSVASVGRVADMPEAGLRDLLADIESGNLRNRADQVDNCSCFEARFPAVG